MRECALGPLQRQPPGLQQSSAWACGVVMMVRMYANGYATMAGQLAGRLRRCHKPPRRRQLSSIQIQVYIYSLPVQRLWPSIGMLEDLPRVAGILEDSRVSSMLPWKGLGMSNATAHTTDPEGEANSGDEWMLRDVSEMLTSYGILRVQGELDRVMLVTTQKTHELMVALRFVLRAKRPLQPRQAPARRCAR